MNDPEMVWILQNRLPELFIAIGILMLIGAGFAYGLYYMVFKRYE